MQLFGKNSLFFWGRYPLFFYTIGFTAITIWSSILILFHILNGKYDSLVTYNSETIRLKIPFSQMVLVTENTMGRLLLTLLGLISLSFILIFVFKITLALSKEKIFTSGSIKNMKVLGIGFILFALMMSLIEFIFKENRLNFAVPLFYIAMGLAVLFLKEVFAKAKILQDQSDLTI